MIEHHCLPSDWIQGAISIVYLSEEQGQLGIGWHIVFWESETKWSNFLSIIFCPYCGLKLEEPENAREGDVDWEAVAEWALEDDHTAMIGHAAFECTDAAITMEGNNG